MKEKFFDNNLTLLGKDVNPLDAHKGTGEIQLNYRNILNTITEGIYAIDHHGVCVYVNNACWQILGFDSAGDVLGQNMHRLVHYKHINGELYPGRHCKIGKALREGVEIIADDEVFWHKTGRAIPVRYHAYPQFEQNELIGAVVSFYDISREQLQQKLLEVSENKFRNIFTNANAGIVFVDEDGYTLAANSAFLEIVQYTVDEIRTIGFENLVVEEDWKREQSLRQQLLSGERESYRMEKRYIRKDRKIVWVSIHVSAFRDNPQSLFNFVTVVTDINDRKSVELQLKESNKTKDKFISIISHDLRNPIGSIKSLSALMADELITGDGNSVKEYAELICFQADQTFDLLNNLLEWSKSQLQFEKFQIEEIILSEVIHEAVDHLQLLAFNKSLKINISCPAELKVHAERHMLATVLRNLITNAIKFSYDGHEINIKANHNIEDIIVSVQDNGKGMSAAIKEKLFEKGLPVTSAGTANEQGTGLGLLLSKEIIELLGGRIWVKSDVGQGATFYFTLKRIHV